MLSHRNVIDNALTFARVHYTADDRLLVAAPLFHCWGLINGVLGMFAVGHGPRSSAGSRPSRCST